MHEDPSHVLLRAMQSHADLLQDALLRLGEAPMPLSRLRCPPSLPRKLDLPEDVADSGPLEQRHWLLYNALPEDEAEEEEEAGEEEAAAGPWVNPALKQEEEKAKERGKAAVARMKTRY